MIIRSRRSCTIFVYSQGGSGLCVSFIGEEFAQHVKNYPNVNLVRSSQDHTTLSRPNLSAQGTSHGAKGTTKGEIMGIEALFVVSLKLVVIVESFMIY